MINGKKVLAIIPARGGSKGVPRKNIRDVAGKPLIAWTILAAQKSRYIDRLILSSEDAEIIDVAKAWGCDVPFVRPADLAQDETSGMAPVFHALQTLPGYDYVVLLQPTSPLRETSDIDGCIALCDERGAPACVSVAEPSQHPHWMFRIDETGRLQALFDNIAARRQDLPPVYAINGAVYVADTAKLMQAGDFLGPETIAYVMPEVRSMDIDTSVDLLIAEHLLLGKKLVS